MSLNDHIQNEKLFLDALEIEEWTEDFARALNVGDTVTGFVNDTTFTIGVRYSFIHKSAVGRQLTIGEARRTLSPHHYREMKVTGIKRSEKGVPVRIYTENGFYGLTGSWCAKSGVNCWYPKSNGRLYKPKR